MKYKFVATPVSTTGHRGNHKHSTVNAVFRGCSNMALQQKWYIFSQIWIQDYYEINQPGKITRVSRLGLGVECGKF